VTDRDVKNSEDYSATSLSLLERAKASDQKAWDRLVTLYSPLVYKWCLKAKLQPADAEDIGQKVWWSVARNLANFHRDRPDDTFRGWLHTITVNKIHDLHRTSTRESITNCTYCRPVLNRAPDDSCDDCVQEKTLVLHQALAMIQGDFLEKTWTAFWRVSMEGQAASTVAADMQMTTGAVYSAIGRVVARLRQEFAGLLPDGVLEK
jgi:RNA polymerase sigma-70 factor (ECF subfamily)